MSRWVKLYEDADNHEVFYDAGSWQLFTYLVMKACIDRDVVRGVRIGRGQCLYSRSYLAYVCKSTEATIKKRLDKLVSLGCISTEPAGQAGTIINILNYDKYQGGIEGGIERGIKNDPHTDPQAIPNTKNNRIIEYNDDVVVDAHARENWKIEMIDGLNEQWMTDVSQELRIPMDKMTEWREEFRLKMKTEGSTSLTPHEHIKHFKNFLRNKKVLMWKEQRNSQTINHTSDDKPRKTRLVSEQIKELLS